MLISTRGRLMSAILMIVALALTAVSLFTCHWSNSVFFTMDRPIGLFAQDGCYFFDASPSWNTATFVLMIIAFAAEIVLIVFAVTTSLLLGGHNCHLLKADLFLITITFLALLATLITYGITATNYWDGTMFKSSLGYSYYLVIPAAFFALLAMGPVNHALHAIHWGHGDGDWRF